MKDWKNMMFTDEKKFNLDGPDGIQLYWHDLRKQPEIHIRSRYKNGVLLSSGVQFSLM